MVTLKDLKFTKQGHGGIGATLNTKAKITISIQAGEMVYSSPRQNILKYFKGTGTYVDPGEYDSFEVALFNVKGNFITRKFIKCDGEVAGWVSEDVINNLIYQLEK
tara:strand:+ start:152 stop:469 length:318 start_codon:yes stop_codon:yes gene_type:complete